MNAKLMLLLIIGSGISVALMVGIYGFNIPVLKANAQSLITLPNGDTTAILTISRIPSSQTTLAFTANPQVITKHLEFANAISHADVKFTNYMSRHDNFNYGKISLIPPSRGYTVQIPVDSAHEILADPSLKFNQESDPNDPDLRVYWNVFKVDNGIYSLTIYLK